MTLELPGDHLLLQSTNCGHTSGI